MKNIGIVGAGGFAREVLWLIEDLGLAGRIQAFYESDDIWKDRSVSGIPVLPVSRFVPSATELVIGIGSPAARRNIVAALPAETTFPVFIHPSVQRSRRIEIGAGTVICAGSILTCDIRLDEHVQLNLATTVGHDCHLKRFVTTAPAVNISGACTLGEATYIGTNACLREGLAVPAETVIGMGAVMVSTPAEAGTYVGNPARRIQK